MGLFDELGVGGFGGMGGLGSKQFGQPIMPTEPGATGMSGPPGRTPASPFGALRGQPRGMTPAQPTGIDYLSGGGPQGTTPAARAGSDSGVSPQIPQGNMAAGGRGRGMGGSSVGGGMNQPMMSDLSQSLESKAQKTRLNFMDALAQIESSGGTNTKNLLSPSHVGKYQMSKTAFQRFSNGGDINDPAQQEQAARAYADYNRNSLKQILGRDPTDPEVYLSYNQGLAGAHRLLSNPGVPAGKLVKPQHIAANGGDPAAPASQFINMMTQKWNDLSQGAEAGAQ